MVDKGSGCGAGPARVFRLSGGGSGLFSGRPWTFFRGRQWVVTGPNGSGKSYLAALLAGEAPPPAGLSIEWDESVEGRVALVSFSQQQGRAAGGWRQERWHALEGGDEAGVRQFLSYEGVFEINPFEVRGADAAGRRRFAGRLAAACRAFRLRPLLGRRLCQLSNGETRRVLIARALLRDPALLVLDDPFAGLDAEMRGLLKSALDALAARGLPMVMMLRSPAEIPGCATHLLTLKGLRIASAGPLRRRPAPARTPGADVPGGEGGWGIEPRPPDPSAPAVVEMRGLTLRYGRRVLFRGLDWTVRRGERWLVVGPNGSGKTTLMSLITGDNPRAYAADIRVFGEPRAPGRSLWDVRSRIGQVSPEIQCYFDLRLNAVEAVLSGECGAGGGRPAATRARRERALLLLGELGIRGPASRLPLAGLSAGEQRLALLARALFPEPDLLLLDEPCANLDAASRRRVLRIIERLLRARPGLTAVCIAHRRENVPRGFGRLLDLGAPSEKGA